MVMGNHGPTSLTMNSRSPQRAPMNDRTPTPEEREEWEFQASLELQQQIEEDYQRDQAEAWALEDYE